jgi:hypothetical protein
MFPQPLKASEAGDVACSALAGIETGVLGGVLVIAWYAAVSWLEGDPAWTVPARLAAAIYGPGVAHAGRLMAAAAGAALEVSAAGILGGLFGLLMRAQWCARRALPLGLLLGLGWYYVGYRILPRELGWAAASVFSLRSALLAHLAFGLFLAAYPRFLRSVRAGGLPAG